MINEARQIFVVSFLFLTIGFSAYMVAQLHAQDLPSADFRNASIAEVKNAQHEVVLRGQFEVVEADEGETERQAILGDTTGARKVGEAEVEFPTAGYPQEIDFAIENVEPGATFTFVIDGQDVGTARADRSGKAEFEREIRNPASR